MKDILDFVALEMDAALLGEKIAERGSVLRADQEMMREIVQARAELAIGIVRQTETQRPDRLAAHEPLIDFPWVRHYVAHRAVEALLKQADDEEYGIDPRAARRSPEEELGSWAEIENFAAYRNEALTEVAQNRTLMRAIAADRPLLTQSLKTYNDLMARAVGRAEMTREQKLACHQETHRRQGVPMTSELRDKIERLLDREETIDFTVAQVSLDMVLRLTETYDDVMGLRPQPPGAGA
jgi:hypothetical protein